MSGASALVIAPILLPLLAGAGMLLLNGERHRWIVAGLNVGATFALVCIATILLGISDSGTRDVYRLGNWPAPFGIVLVLDRLSALMLLLTNILALASVVYSLARWHRAGAHFHSLFQFLLMGLNGAFLTGDLFNLFVFFELLLAASYGLLLHGSGLARVKAGLHYIVVNLAASLLFLIGVSLIYGVTGTLNMADLAARVPAVAAESRGLLEAGAGVLAVAFLLKAGMWPLNFWLPTAYAAASPPVASIFAILTKVGVYIVLRLSLLLFGEDAGASAGFGREFLLLAGLATILFGAVGTLASQDTARLGGFSVLVSSGTVLAATGMGQVGVTSGALFYLVSSTLGIGAFFLLVELIERGREPGADMIAVTREAYGEEIETDEAEADVGLAIVATMAWLGIAFIGCALVIAGLPPLSGFIAKFALLAAALHPAGQPGGAIPGSGWALLAVLILSGFATLVAMARAGIRIFWTSPDRTVPRVRVIEMAPIMLLLFICAAQTVWAGPVLRFMQAAAQCLHAPAGYISDVLDTGSRSRQAEGK